MLRDMPVVSFKNELNALKATGRVPENYALIHRLRLTFGQQNSLGQLDYYWLQHDLGNGQLAQTLVFAYASNLNANWNTKNSCPNATFVTSHKLPLPE